MNSTLLPSCYFGTHRQCFAAANLTWPTYVDGRKRENCFVWTDRIIVASTYRHSVQFDCYITWLWMANCVSVMTKILQKRHDLRTHKQQAVSDWLNQLSLGSFTVATYTFACLRSTTQSNVWANIDDGHMGTLNKIGWELFIILWNDPNVHTDTNYFCMKECSALNTRNYTLQVIKSNHFEVSTHVPT